MKKSTLKALINYLNGEQVTNIDEIASELQAEYNRYEEKAQANRDLYSEAKPIVLEGLAQASAPVTLSELYDSIASDLPEGFTKGKVQYLVTRLCEDEIVKIEGKVNTYALKG